MTDRIPRNEANTLTEIQEALSKIDTGQDALIQSSSPSTPKRGDNHPPRSACRPYYPQRRPAGGPASTSCSPA